MGRLNPFWESEDEIEGVNRNDDEETGKEQQEPVSQGTR